MRGCNVTMPCKNKVAQCVDELSPAAKIIGAVNTIVNEDGKLVGHITDGIGFVRNLKEHGVDVKGKKMVVLGAGGAATALLYSVPLTELHPSRSSILTIHSLTEQKELLRSLQKKYRTAK